jgi:hypothetical protein
MDGSALIMTASGAGVKRFTSRCRTTNLQTVLDLFALQNPQSRVPHQRIDVAGIA